MSENKRIAKNTMVLYLRMLLTVGISLYTTRLVMAGLGVADYGLYAIVGSVTTTMYMITHAVGAGISRFLTFELGAGNKENLRKVFSSSIIILWVFSAIIILLCETVGLWFLNNQLNIESSRMVAANWVFQISIVAFVLEFLSIPYNASLISHERMTAFAFITILDVLIQQGIAFSIAYSPFDALIYYALLVCVDKLILRIIYYYYCRVNFEECRFCFQFDKRILKSLLSYSGWTLLSSVATMFVTSGTAFLINIYYGTIVNAAQRVSEHVKGTLYAFSTNFLRAINPQITKTYAAGDHERSLMLIYSGAKVSFLLLYFVALPVMYESSFLLDIWLEEVPPFATLFVNMIIVRELIQVLLKTSETIITATGDVKKFYIKLAISRSLPFPLTWILFELGFPPYFNIIANIVALLLIFYPCVVEANRYINVSWHDFTRLVLRPLCLVVLTSNLCLFLICCYMEESWVRLIINCGVSVSVICLTAYFFVLSSNERSKVKQVVMSRLTILQ